MSGCSGWARRWSTPSRPARRSTSWRAISSLGCCACRGVSGVVVRRLRGALMPGAVMPPREHMFVCRRCAPSGGGTDLSADGDAVSGRHGVGSPEKLESLLLPAAASRELETAHRRLIGLHLEKELKSARVLREMRHTR